ncbi:hypothetical protein K2X85_08455 [bacterium]|nr:hypothetical protein [bacterium]
MMELTRRQMRILAFIARYRAATDELLRRKFVPAHRDIEFIRRTMVRLVQRGYVREFKIAKGERYYLLTRRGARTTRGIDHTPRELTEQSLPSVLGIGYFCVAREINRYTAAEFRRKYPDLSPRRLRSSVYYSVETEVGMKIGLFIVDAGGTQRRVHAKIRRQIAKRMSLPSFVSLIHAGHLRVTILVSTEIRREKLSAFLAKRSFGDVEVEVAWVPELEQLEG